VLIPKKNLFGNPKQPLSAYSFGQVGERPEEARLGEKEVRNTSIESSPNGESTESGKEKTYVNPLDTLGTGGAFSRAVTLLGKAGARCATPPKMKSFVQQSPDPENLIGSTGPAESRTSMRTPGFAGHENVMVTETKNLITDESCPVVTDIDPEVRLKDWLCPKVN
jgi:hypothetical protein